jgi:Uncharacterised nucleotidyltransferase
MAGGSANFARIQATLKKTASALKAADLDFVLAGGVACWARGGPASAHDVDYMVRPEHAEQALDALVEAGLKPQRPPEEWLYKAWDGDVLVDLIYHPMGMVVDDELFERSGRLDVLGVTIPVMQVDDVLTAKLLAMHEHYLDYEPLIDIARSVREQIDWAALRERTRDSPYARAFFVITAGLGISDEEPGEPIQPGGLAPDGRRAVERPSS